MSNFGQTLKDIVSSLPSEPLTKSSRQCQAIRFFSQDESRVGTLPIQRKRITLNVIKPIAYVAYEFKSYYLYGVIEPKSG